MRKNSQRRISARRKVALAGRTAQLGTWQKAFIADANSDHNKMVLAKIAKCEAEIATLGKRVSSFS